MTDDTDRPEPIQSIADAHRLNLSAMPRVEAALTAAFEAGRRTPAPVSGDMREMVKRAVLPIIDKVPAVDASQSRIREIRAGWMADAVLPLIAAEIAAAREEGRRDERAAVVAFGSPTQFITWGKQVARFIDAIERGEHRKGDA